LLEVTAFGAPRPGETNMLCIRPHALSLEPHAAAGNCIEGTVTEVQWRGSAHRLYLDVDGMEMCADSKPLRIPPQRGQRVALHFSTHEATLLAGPVGAAAGDASARSD
jgi:2-aminoethylphosphonate transport system ATP-binding protein